MTRPTSLKHAEAFCIMTYRADDGSEEEQIWNSRDGVTPFCVALRSGKSAKHVDWHRDVYAPDYKPPAGSRMFVDLTPERAEEIARMKADLYWSDTAAVYNPQSEWATKEAFVQSLLASYLQLPGAPDIVVVGEDD
jgi:hypothetical protein